MELDAGLFSIRPDIVPAWAIATLILYAPRPREWAKIPIPVALFLAIGLSWALFKRQYTGEFKMTTHSFGASLMVGMWDAPHPFVWSSTDGAYFGCGAKTAKSECRKARPSSRTPGAMVVGVSSPYSRPEFQLRSHIR